MYPAFVNRYLAQKPGILYTVAFTPKRDRLGFCADIQIIFGHCGWGLGVIPNPGTEWSSLIVCCYYFYYYYYYYIIIIIIIIVLSYLLALHQYAGPACFVAGCFQY